MESALPSAQVLLEPLPDSGFVGSGVDVAHKQLITWLNKPNRVIGVYGMAGVGKTTLLRLIYNSYQENKEVSGIFDSVIWLTVSQKYEIADLQTSIAKTLGLNLKAISNIDSRKMRLSAILENKRFLLILDDVWRPIDLNEIGAKFGDHNQSKVLISSRSRDVVEIMAENEYCKMIEPLSKDEGWELFQRRAFRSGVVPDNNLLAIATEVASECKGLPLTINTVAAAMAWKKTADEWIHALNLMKIEDPSFPSTTQRTIDAELYQRLRWSYNDLPDYELKMCFLYCAAFPEDAEIEVDRLVETWTAEGLVPQKEKTYFMDTGREYIDALVDRCLIEYVDTEKQKIKVHDVLRDMAIYIGEGEENWLFLASQHLQNFPNEEQIRDRKRISVADNEIIHLPADLKCPTLVSLVLAGNKELEEIPERFLANLTSLKVLDLSDTSIQALPTSVGQLGELEFINLAGCGLLEDLPDSICKLSHLQFLNLEDCDSLDYLPDRIGELKNLKHLQVTTICPGFEVIPEQISQLTLLNKLDLPTPLKAEDLSNLANLIELDIIINPDIKGGSMSSWSEMRKLSLKFFWREYEIRDDAALDILPQNMQNMKKLQSISLYEYLGASLPNCICQFQNLKYLSLWGCSKLKELPALEIGSEAASDSFPMLQELELSFLESLESIVWNEGTMLKLQSLNIYGCKMLETFRTEELPNLRSLSIRGCDKLKEWFTHTGGFPMLESLDLSGLPNLEVNQFRECCSKIEHVE